MNNEKIVEFLKSKKDKIEHLKTLSRDDVEFRSWYESLQATAERMGQSYKTRVNSWNFWPSFYIPGQPDNSREEYLNGLSEAEASLESMIEEIELWGEPASTKPTSSKKSEKDVIFNLTISQQQAQQLSNEIEIEQYEPEVREMIKDLLQELQKKNKNRDKIVSIVKWLADKSVDALVALIAIR